MCQRTRVGDPGMTRICDLRFRKPSLYPAEVRDRLDIAHEFLRATGFAPILLRCTSLWSTPFSGKRKVSSSERARHPFRSTRRQNSDETAWNELPSFFSSRGPRRLCRLLLCAALSFDRQQHFLLTG